MLRPEGDYFSLMTGVLYIIPYIYVSFWINNRPLIDLSIIPAGNNLSSLFVVFKVLIFNWCMDVEVGRDVNVMSLPVNSATIYFYYILVQCL